MRPDELTGLTPFGQAIFGGPLMIVLFLGTLGIVFFLSFRINRLQAGTALVPVHGSMPACSALMLSSVFLTYTGTLDHPHLLHLGGIVRRAQPLRLHHAARSLADRLVPGHGPVRADPGDGRQHLPEEHGARLRDLGDRRLDLRRATAWDTQKIKEMYSANDDGTVSGRKAVMGALTLYLDFINLFLFLLRFMGDRR